MNHHFFLSRKREFIECELVENTPFRRKIKLLEGEKKGKVLSIHPEGIRWGNIYPRLFQAPVKPASFFVHKGRVLISHEEFKNNPAVPKVDKKYRFQPFLIDVMDSIHAKENVLLTGGTGVGKTTHIVQVAARINQPILRINFNGETRMSDLIGKMNVVGGETRWTDGVLPQAMRMGYWLLLDELDFADPSVLSLLHPVLEDDSLLVLKENSGEIVRPHPNFRLFATANSIGAMQDRAGAYHGTNQMNEAFLDRWQVLMVDNLNVKEETKVIKGAVPGLKAKWAKQIVDFANKARNKDISENFEFSGDNFSTRKTLKWAQKTALHRSPIVGAKLAWLDKLPKEEQTVMIQILTTHFGSGRKNKDNPLKAKTVGVPMVKAVSNTVAPKKRGRPKTKI